MKRRGRGGGAGPRPHGGGAPHDDPARRERARKTLDEALDRGEDPERAARAALRVSGECVEAWLLLADTAASAAEARDRVRRAVAASTHVLGEARLRAGRGRLGEDPDGAAHLHALGALARQQVAEERVEQAIQTLLAVVALDRADPVQVRGDLLLLLLSQARDDEAEELVAAYPEEAGAEWMYGRALLRRRRATDAASLARADAALDRAIARHRDAGRALLERARAGDDGPHETRDVEAVLGVAWQDTEGAVPWLEDRLAKAAEPAARAPAPVDPESDRRFSAREHVEEGWNAPPPRRAALAEAALAIWPDCAEAWRLLATAAGSPAEEVDRLREAVRAADRALGAARSSQAAGDREEAREALRAGRDLALALRRAGDEDGALAQERAVLERDPDDPLGVAVPHVARLLVLGRDAEAEPVLDARAEDAGPGWVWARLLARRRAGDSVGASFALAEAMLSAPLVAPMLLGAPLEGEGLPEHADAWVQARAAAETLRPAWEATPGALAWLRERLPPPAPRSRSRPRRGR